MALALGSRKAAAAPRTVRASRPQRVMPVVQAKAAAAADVPDMNKRNIMNLILLGGIGLPVGSLAVPYALFFVPVRCELTRRSPGRPRAQAPAASERRASSRALTSSAGGSPPVSLPA